MTDGLPRLRRPLRYTIRCHGCRAELEIAPEELDQRLAVCGRCGQANPTPVYALLSGRRQSQGTPETEA
ncbi:MAG: hypothetical protein HS108_04260 [Planctomycetes bacterium]|jgi:rRNA maturation endonuclease Nob1|nr:hypothetical protein [Planctomycetota bacterium]MCL4731326.1 hypothetical protein [Planctomycetota bacterium]